MRQDDPAKAIEAQIRDHPESLGEELMQAGFVDSLKWRDAEQALAHDGLNVLTELFRDHQDDHFDCWIHFPADDAFDPASGARFYYHAHEPEDWPLDEHGHFHLFVPNPRAPDNKDAFCHIGAISMSPKGEVRRLFMTNQWVTAEQWVPAEELIEVLPESFLISRARPSYLVAQWLMTLVSVLQLHLAALLVARDQAVSNNTVEGMDVQILKDRERHILAEMPVDMKAVISAWEQGFERFFGLDK